MLAPPPITVLRGHVDAVNSIAFCSPAHLISCSVSGHIKIFDLLTRRVSIDVVSAHEDSVLSVGTLGCDRIFISAGKDGYAHMWDMENTLAPVASFSSGALHFCNSATDKDKCDNLHFVTPAASESNILYWDKRSPSAAICISAPSNWPCGMLTSLLYRSNDSTGSGKIVAGYEDGSVLSFDLRRPMFADSAKLRRIISHPVLAVAMTSDNRSIVAGGGSTDMCIATGNDSEFLNSSGDFTNSCFMEKISLKRTGTSTINFRGDDRIFLSGHWDGTVRIIERKSLKLLAILRHHREAVYCTDFIGDSLSTDAVHFGCSDSNIGVFATGSKDGTIALWNLFADKIKRKS